MATATIAQLHRSVDPLADFYAPGNVIFSDYWRTYNRVLSYHPTTPVRFWYVEVIHCDAKGTPLPGERPRIHCTHPDRRDRVVLRAGL